MVSSGTFGVTFSAGKYVGTSVLASFGSFAASRFLSALAWRLAAGPSFGLILLNTKRFFREPLTVEIVR